MKNSPIQITEEKRNDDISGVTEMLYSEDNPLVEKKSYQIMKTYVRPIKSEEENINEELFLWIEDVKKFRLFRDFALFNFTNSFPKTYTAQVNGKSKTYKLTIVDVGYGKPQKECA